MRYGIGLAFMLAAGFAAAPLARGQSTEPASEPATMAASAPAPAEAVDALKMLEQRDQTLKDFTAAINYAVYHPRTDDTVVSKGDVAYLKAGDSAKFAVHFTLEGASGDYHRADHTLIFDGRWFIDCDTMNKIFHKTQLVAPDSKIEPLKLGQGPIPIPIGQDTQKILRDFTVSVEPTDPKMTDAADIVHLKLVPRSHDLCKAYDMNSLELWVNRKLQLPVKLVREDLDSNTTTIVLDRIKINSGEPKVFDMPTPKASDGWNIQIDTLDENKPAQ